MIGTNVSHYEIREKLGAGGMGVVYKAWDTRLERWVALKFLPQQTDDDPIARERFMREAKAASSLEHPHICTVHEIGETDDNQLFICMAFYGGGNLRKTIKTGRVTTQRAFQIVRQISHALSSAHEAGIVHRDIKPSNIMLTEQGDVAIVDFGLAKLSDEFSITRSGATLGTVAYMSPEQIRGRKLDFRTDLWSLGVILYQLLTGEHPFNGDYDRALQRAILEDEPIPPSGLNPGLPEHIDLVVAKLLAKDRNQRFTSAGEVEQTFRALAQPTDSEMPTQAAIPNSRSGTERLRARWKSMVMALALVSAAVAIWLIWRPPPPPQSVQTLAVRPFSNFTGDDSNSYVGDGIPATLILSLSELRGLTVLGRSEAWKYRDENLGARALGRKLGVEILLEGAIHATPAGFRVETSLIDVPSGEVLWSAEDQGSVTELRALARDIGDRLTRVLKVSISEQERKRLSRDPTESYEAYEYYLRGQEFLADRLEAENLESAIELFRQAIRIDPDFALAHVALSEGLWEMSQRDGDSVSLRMAREEAEKALDLDPELPAALIAMARVQRTSGRYIDSIAALEDVLSGHPDPAAAHRELSLSYERAGDLDSAEDELRAATLIGPENWQNWNSLGGFLWRKGDFGKARDAFQEAIQLAPADLFVPHRNLGGNEISRGNWEEAILVLESVPESEFTSTHASNLGTAYYFSDRPDRLDTAARHYATAARLNPRDDQVRRNLADVLLIQGNQAQARAQYLEALRLVDEKLLSDPSSWVLRLRRSFYAARGADCPTALATMDSLSLDLPKSAYTAHYSAYVFALCDDRDRALRALSAAIAHGVKPETLRKEPEFESLRDDPEFRALTESGVSIPP